MKEFIEESYSEEIDNKSELKNVLFGYLIYWKWFILSVALCTTGAWFYLRYATPVYNVSATVMIRDDKRGGQNSEVQALENMGLLVSSSSSDNEIEIIRSKSLIKQVVTELKTYAGYTTKGHIGSRDLYTQSPVRVVMQPASLDSLKFGFGFEAICRPDGSVHISGNIGGKNITSHIAQLPANLETPIGVLTLTSCQEAEPIFNETIYIQVSPPIQVAKAYLGALSITNNNSGTSIATIDFSTTHPQRGEDFVNKLIEVYNREANNDKNSVAIKTAEFINERIQLINHELGNTEAELEGFKRNAGLTTLEDAQMYVQENANYSKKSVEIGTQLNLMDYLSEFVSAPATQDAIIPANVGVADASLSSLIQQYNEMLLQRNRLLRSSSSTNPVIVKLSHELTSLRTDIQASIGSLRQSLSIAQKDLSKQTSKFSARISNVPTQERALTNIARQQEIKAGLYLMLLQKREENSIALAATADNAKIIDEAMVNDGTIAPNYSLIRMIAFVVGLLIPIIIITLINFFRIRIEGRADVEKLTRLPILGEVPLDYIRQKEESDIVVKENENTMMTEVFRELRTNLQFILSTPESKVILITSTTSGEGKTFVASNLAASLAMLGKKVVIVGLDIRKPRLPQSFGFSSQHHQEGITHFLRDPRTDLMSLLQSTPNTPNLMILATGAIPPNPAELLARPSLDEAIEQLSRKFDYVLLDSAPVGLVTDTLIAARVASTTIYLCRTDYSLKSDFEFINQLQREKKLPGMAMVVNATNMKKRKYGYGYGKRYGYGYGAKK